jgi:hypothetical protein
LNTHKQPCKQGSFYTQAAFQTKQLLHTSSLSNKAAFTHKQPSNKAACTHKKPFKQGSFYTQKACSKAATFQSSHDSKWKR